MKTVTKSNDMLFKELCELKLNTYLTYEDSIWYIFTDLDVEGTYYGRIFEDKDLTVLLTTTLEYFKKEK